MPHNNASPPLSLDKGKSAENSTSSLAYRRWEALERDEASSSKSTYFEVPSNHFLARSGAPLSTSSLNLGSTSSQGVSLAGSTSSRSKDARREKDGLHALGSEKARSIGSLSSADRDPLSHIPSHVTQAFDIDSHALSGGQQSRPFMPDTSTLAAADFDIDVRSGFLPPQAPVSRLEGIEEELWECALDRAMALPLRIGGGGEGVSDIKRREARTWRRSVREMLILHPSPQLTSDIRYARRAHLVLSFLAHFYIHSQPKPEAAPRYSWHSMWSVRTQDDKDRLDEQTGKYSSTIPASIAVPWVALSRQLDLPPILTYATSVLWNWSLRDSSLGFSKDNTYMTTTFSGTPSEQHFYKTSLLIEKRGVDALTLMRRSLDEAFVGDSLARRRISLYLGRLSSVIQDLTNILHDVRLGCVPSTFYWGIRPWFNGGDSFVDKSTGEKGWIFEGVDEFEGKRKVFTGPSAGQSSLIHALDVFLGVDHSKKEDDQRSGSERENATFMEKMQLYMPGLHRNFLIHLKGISFASEEDQARHADDESQVERHPLRALMTCEDSDGDPAVETLRLSYNEVLTSLKHLRDEHMRVATLYIISQTKLAPPPEFALLAQSLVEQPKVEREGAGRGTESKGIKGTGGTDLVSFLKDCRKNTIAALRPAEQ